MYPYLATVLFVQEVVEPGTQPGHCFWRVRRYVSSNGSIRKGGGGSGGRGLRPPLLKQAPSSAREVKRINAMCRDFSARYGTFRRRNLSAVLPAASLVVFVAL